MGWSDAEAAARYHLRLMMGAGWFVNPKCRTMQQLRQDPVVQHEWKEYLHTQEVPAGVSRITWKRQIEEAKQWLTNVPGDTEMKMLCEVQMVLNEYSQARTAMHEIYKIVRVSSEEALHNEFAKYERAFRMQQNFLNDGDTAFKRACRDGDAAETEQLLHLSDIKDIQTGLRIACKHVRPACVRILLGPQQETQVCMCEVEMTM